MVRMIRMVSRPQLASFHPHRRPACSPRGNLNHLVAGRSSTLDPTLTSQFTLRSPAPSALTGSSLAILQSNFHCPVLSALSHWHPIFHSSTPHPTSTLHIFLFFIYTIRFLPFSDHRRRHTPDDNPNHDHYRLAAPVHTPAARG